MVHKAETWRKGGSHPYLRRERAKKREQQTQMHILGLMGQHQGSQCGWKTQQGEVVATRRGYWRLMECVSSPESAVRSH